MRAGTKFPHDDIEEDGPPVSAVLCALSRDDPEYRGAPDHDGTGLLVGGPKGERNPLAREQYYTHCARPDLTTPENVRKRKVVESGRDEIRLQQELGDRYQPPAKLIQVGRFLYPKKPLNSGRKRRAA